eukprot:CAMPEP_0115473426 /NCGR_PEP_ID=MMETSP0271-20121206/53562_1 /TAXON_ID=71861 /ORGANISM="Scrippsiella trochoidea, Strain CCMP3099" /LENGTH=105 /DNA_ID=CAMNT_0002900701 /DNA_START=463 /DNA_END=777 /DNA_ORIENTATION=+
MLGATSARLGRRPLAAPRQPLCCRARAWAGVGRETLRRGDGREQQGSCPYRQDDRGEKREAQADHHVRRVAVRTCTTCKTVAIRWIAQVHKSAHTAHATDLADPE